MQLNPLKMKFFFFSIVQNCVHFWFCISPKYYIAPPFCVTYKVYTLYECMCLFVYVFI